MLLAYRARACGANGGAKEHGVARVPLHMSETVASAAVSDDPVVLFLCTGNYYRSRFAEVLFNHLARERGSCWRAESLGLDLAIGVNNVGPISPPAAFSAESPRCPTSIAGLPESFRGTLKGETRPTSRPAA